jgi:hypothetical protein
MVLNEFKNTSLNPLSATKREDRLGEKEKMVVILAVVAGRWGGVGEEYVG